MKCTRKSYFNFEENNLLKLTRWFLVSSTVRRGVGCIHRLRATGWKRGRKNVIDNSKRASGSVYSSSSSSEKATRMFIKSTYVALLKQMRKALAETTRSNFRCSMRCLSACLIFHSGWSSICICSEASKSASERHLLMLLK